MAGRIVYLTDARKINIKNSQLVIQDDCQAVSVPVEDISVLVVDTPKLLVSSYCLSFMSTQGIVIVFTDKMHLPNSMLLPYAPHHRFLEKASLQLQCSKPLKNQLWKAIMIQKLINQATVLKKVNPEKAMEMEKIAHSVKSGDRTNRESVGARLYWNNLFRDFKRGREDITNRALNFGYAIVRSAVARSLVASGFICAFGIHHHNTLNPFNLADDIIEPFRPFIDKQVCDMVTQLNSIEELGKEEKATLIQTLHAEVVYNNLSTPLLTMIEVTCTSLFRAIETKNPDALLLPSVI